jgi:hypothetical protein
LPRSTKSKRIAEEAGGVATLEPEEGIDEMTTATDQDPETDEELDSTDPRFTYESMPAPADFQPDRKTPGRVRQPSYFDTVLRHPDVFESGQWQMVPVNSKEHAEATKRELNRAKLWLNKTGLEEDPPLPEIGLDLDEREDAVYYKSRTAQKRERRANGSANGSAIDQDELEFDPEEGDEE